MFICDADQCTRLKEPVPFIKGQALYINMFWLLVLNGPTRFLNFDGMRHGCTHDTALYNG